MHAQDLLNAGFDVEVILGLKTKDALVVLGFIKTLFLDGHIHIATDDGTQS